MNYNLIYLKFYTILFLSFSFLTFSQETFNYKSRQTYSTEQNQPIDIVFKSKQAKPFDVEFRAVFNFENKESISVPGFYNGNDEFVIRFNPEKIGKYTFQVNSDQKDLNGLSGQVISKAQSSLTKLPKIQIDSKNPQKFAYQNDKPYFALAFELDWLFALDYPQNNILTQSKQIIESIKSNGFNQVVMNVYAYNVGWPVAKDVPAQYDYKKPNYSVFKGTNESPDFTELNIDFFKNLDRKIQLLHENGLASHLMIYVWNKKVNWPKMYSKEDNQYFDYIIKRYQAYPNIIWDVSKEALDYGRCDIPYINERIERIRKNDAYKHLITVHDYEYCSREPEKVDFISIQNWRSDLYSNTIDAVQKYPNKPIMNIEHGGYEKGPYATFVGNYTNPEICLERNYQCVFAGVYSTYYWQNTSWDIVIYDALQLNTIPKPSFDYYKHLNTLFTKYNFNELKAYKPKLTINSRIGTDNFSTSGYPLTNDKGLYLYFVPKENDFINTVIPKPESNQVKVTYFNIFTGETKEEIETYQLFKTYTSPWKGQVFVLIVESV